MKALALLLLAAGCYCAPPDELGDQCDGAGIGTLDAAPGDCVVLRDNPLTPWCQYDFAFYQGGMFRPGECVAFTTDGSRVYLRNTEVTYGPLAPGEKCSCDYVSRSR